MDSTEFKKDFILLRRKTDIENDTHIQPITYSVSHCNGSGIPNPCDEEIQN